MSLTDFLFQGSPPPSVTTYNSTSSSIPPWFEAYQQALLGKSNVVAGEQFPQYTTQPGSPGFDAVTNSRVAPINGYTNQGWQLGMDAATSYKPELNNAMGSVAGALSMPNASAASSPWLGRAAGAPGGAATAQPYEQQGALSWTNPGTAQSYMNPFTDQVANRLTELSNRNLTENVLPGISDNFVKSGMFGSSRQGDFTNRAIRDQGDSLNGALSNAYSTAYNQGAQQFGADQGRMLQAGQTMGQLQQGDTSNQLQGGNIAGTMANNSQNTAGALGMDQAALARQQQQQGLTGASIYEGIGQQQQQQDQAAINANYNNFQQQSQWPYQQASFMNDMIRGLQAPTSVTGSNTAPAQTYNAPPFAQILGATTGLSGLLGGNRTARRGGRIARAPVERGYLSGGRAKAARVRKTGGWL